MSQNYQTVERRKDNISSIEPLISAMRTISLSRGGWRLIAKLHLMLSSMN